MGSGKRRRADRALRSPMCSPGRHRSHDASIDSGSGKRSRSGSQARTPPSWPACRRRSELVGSVRLVACRRSALPRSRGATCPSPSERSSRSFVPRVVVCGRPLGGLAARRRRSRGSCGATRRPVAAAWSIGPRPRSGTPTGVPADRRWPSWQPMMGSGSTCRTASGLGHDPAGTDVSGPEVRWIGRRPGRRKDRRWASAWSPEQMRTDFGWTSPRMRRCGSPMRPSTRRSMSRVAVPCAVS
jgi:hypothetical protein